MKAKSTIKLVLMLLLIGVMVYLTVAGVTIGNWKLEPASKGIKLGLDIAGGSYIEYQAVGVTDNGTGTAPAGQETAAPEAAATAPASEEATEPTVAPPAAAPVETATADGEAKKEISQEDIDATIATLRSRATSQGYTEATVVYNGGGRFRVELPSVANAEDASRLLGKVARLTFEDPDGNVIVDGKEVKNAIAKFGQTKDNGASEHYVELEFTSEGRTKFSEATGRLIGKAIDIKLDGVVQSSPTVQTKIDSDKAIITMGGENAQKAAEETAALIRSGQLPFGLKEVGASTVSATLGQSAYQRSVQAGLFSLALIILYMIIFYRLPGLLSGIALVFYAVLTILVLGAFGVNLTLPGIAGIVLSMGMAVDANVVIFERIIDELKNGKTLRASVDAGFHRALTAVVDSNVTTLISAGVLWWLGSGTVKGFAITLFIGVVISMFTAIIITKFLLVQLIQLNVKNRRLYGIGVK